MIEPHGRFTDRLSASVWLHIGGGKNACPSTFLSSKFCIRSSLQHLTACALVRCGAKNAAGLRFFIRLPNAFSSNSALDGTQCCSECLGAAQLSIISYLCCPEDADVPSLTPLSARKKKSLFSLIPLRASHTESHGGGQNLQSHRLCAAPALTHTHGRKHT